MGFVVAIDGPAGSGKGTVTEILAKKLKLTSIDTGAMYRCVTLAILRKGIELDDVKKIEEILDTINIELKKENGKQIVKLNGEDVSKEIRDNPVNKMVSKVSAVKEIRSKMVDLQRKMAETQDVIMEGRDITTVVFPNADVKIYMDADLEERAKRRYAQNKSKNIECTYEEVLEDMRQRDENDRNKEVGALKIAEDAIVVDSTHLTQKQVVKKMEKIIKRAKKVKKLEPKIYWERPENKRKQVVRAITKTVLRGLYRIFYRVQITGEENKDKAGEKGGYIICPNHVNYIDAVAIVVFSKERIRFVAKHDLARIGILRWLEHLFDVIPIKRNTQDLEGMKRCLKVLKNDEVLAIFPEGTRNGLEKNGKAKNGAAFMAIRTGKQVVPVGISGTFKLFSKVYINYGEPIDMSKYKIKGQEKECQELATKEIMDNIVMLTNIKK
ncbi:MAG: (d)CMP kinase [Clostridia bacterium]|nr:(d)CMP kinase [Clostridia bacterium]